MQIAGSVSWRIACDQPRLLLLALYVRDAAGLDAVAGPPVPRLEPAVARGGETAPAAASAQWTAWWRRLLVSEPEVQLAMEDAGHGQAALRVLAAHHSRFGPPGYEGLRESPELRDLVARHFPEAEAWGEARRRELADACAAGDRVSVEWDVVRAVERRLGRRARPFRLHVTVLPVHGDQRWQVATEHLVVTRSRYLDAAAWRRDLEPVVAELA